MDKQELGNGQTVEGMYSVNGWMLLWYIRAVESWLRIVTVAPGTLCTLLLVES